MKVCDVASEKGALEAAIFLKLVYIEAKDRLQPIGNWLWCLRDLKRERVLPTTPAVRLRSSGGSSEQPNKRNKTSQSASGAVTRGKSNTDRRSSTRAQTSKSRAHAGDADEQTAPLYPPALEGWDKLSDGQRTHKLVTWWRLHCEQLRTSEHLRSLYSIETPANVCRSFCTAFPPRDASPSPVPGSVRSEKLEPDQTAVLDPTAPLNSLEALKAPSPYTSSVTETTCDTCAHEQIFKLRHIPPNRRRALGYNKIAGRPYSEPM